LYLALFVVAVSILDNIVLFLDNVVLFLDNIVLFLDNVVLFLDNVVLFLDNVVLFLDNVVLFLDNVVLFLEGEHSPITHSEEATVDPIVLVNFQCHCSESLSVFVLLVIIVHTTTPQHVINSNDSIST